MRSAGWVNWPTFSPYWIEEPTSPDDILGHAAVRRALAPIKVATGEHVHNAVMFKQLASGPYYTIRNVNSSLYLGVSGGSTTNGANVVQWAGNGSLDQQWQLVQVSGM